MQRHSRGGQQSHTQPQVYERYGTAHDHHTHSTQPAGDHWTRWNNCVGAETWFLWCKCSFNLYAGEFGIVYKASLAPHNRGTDSRQVVAVKTLRGTITFV